MRSKILLIFYFLALFLNIICENQAKVSTATNLADISL